MSGIAEFVESEKDMQLVEQRRLEEQQAIEAEMHDNLAQLQHLETDLSREARYVNC
jgi:hypothetical protein